MRSRLDGLNELSRIRAIAELSKCCGSRLWAERVADGRPFQDFQRLAAVSDEVWWALDRTDWSEAFSHHPRIGEAGAGSAFGGRTGGTPVPTGASGWAAKEQSGMAGASDEVRLEFA